MAPAGRAFSWYLAGTAAWFASSLSLVSLGFWGGTIGSTLVQIRLGALRRPGRAIVLALFVGAGVPAARKLGAAR